MNICNVNYKIKTETNIQISMYYFNKLIKSLLNKYYHKNQIKENSKIYNNFQY